MNHETPIPPKALESVFGTPISRDDALTSIQNLPEEYEIFKSLSETEQNKILSFIEGQQGIKITYDKFFLKIMSPEEHPERLESLLSTILGQSVKIRQVLPREGLCLSEEASFVVLDIIVQLKDGSYIDVEMQKTGYYFPGQRSCCYASDMIMRQYSRLKNKLKENFTYQSMKPVFLIVLMEMSSSEFKAVSPSYMHHEQHSYDSGAKVRNLANTTYISLDTFRKVVHNIDTKLQAWLTFLSSDSAEDIIKLVTAYPEFKEYYQDIADFRTKPKEWIYMYSKSLAETDRNTERYMVTDMQNTIEKQNAMLAENAVKLAEKDSTIAEKDAKLLEKDSTIAEKDAIILQLKNELLKMQSNTYQENKSKS